MNIPDCPPCDVQNLPPIAVVLVTCAVGTMGLVAAAAVLKAIDFVQSIRERRLNALYRRKP